MPKIVNHKERRHMLATTAGELIANKGLVKTTIREVARTAGVSTGTVSHYYRDSQELLHAAYLTAFTSASLRFIQVLNEGETFEVLLHALFSTLPLEDDVLFEWKVRFAFWGAGDYADIVGRIEAESSEQFRKLVARNLDSLAKRNVIKLRTTSKNAARTIEGLIIGTAVQFMVLRGSESTALVRQRLKKQIIQGVLL